MAFSPTAVGFSTARRRKNVFSGFGARECTPKSGSPTACPETLNFCSEIGPIGEGQGIESRRHLLGREAESNTVRKEKNARNRRRNRTPPSAPV